MSYDRQLFTLLALYQLNQEAATTIRIFITRYTWLFCYMVIFSKILINLGGQSNLGNYKLYYTVHHLYGTIIMYSCYAYHLFSFIYFIYIFVSFLFEANETLALNYFISKILNIFLKFG